MTATTNPLPKDSVYGVARRCVTDLLSPVEIAIRDALVVVEELGADPLLTEASVKLSQAKSLVADWLEGATRDTLPTETRTYQDGSTATGPAPLPLHSPEEQGFSALIVGLGRDGAMAAWGGGAEREARVGPSDGAGWARNVLDMVDESAEDHLRDHVAACERTAPLPPGESAGSARSDEKAPAVGVGSPVSTAMEVLRQLVAAKSTEDRLHRLHEMGHGTDWDQHRKHFAAAWDRAKALVSAQEATLPGVGGVSV